MESYYDFPCHECGEEGENCAYTFPDGKTKRILCGDCAGKAGFCISCGTFFGGTEGFLRSGIRGCCCDCKSEIDHDSDYDDELSEGNYFEPPY